MPDADTETSADSGEWVEVQLDEEDLVALSQHYYEVTPRGRRRSRMLFGFGIVMCAFWAVAVRDHPKYGIDNPTQYALYVGVGIVIILSGFAFMLWYLRPTIARMSARLGAKRGTLKTTRFQLQPDRIKIETGGNTGSVVWESVTSVDVTANHLFVLFGGLNGFIIPVRSFESREAFDAFAAEAKLHFDTAKQ